MTKRYRFLVLKQTTVNCSESLFIYPYVYLCQIVYTKINIFHQNVLCSSQLGMSLTFSDLSKERWPFSLFLSHFDSNLWFFSRLIQTLSELNCYVLSISICRHICYQSWAESWFVLCGYLLWLPDIWFPKRFSLNVNRQF